jgi:hypothetical protein
MSTAFASPLLGQQKGQWVSGQFGPKAGAAPVPAIAYAVIAVDDSVSRLNLIPFYSSQGIGFQANFVMPAEDVCTFLTYCDEYSAKGRGEGIAIDFGFSGAHPMSKPTQL